MPVIRNAAGKPFSKWKPAEKFEYVLRDHPTQIFDYCEAEHIFATDREWRIDYAWPLVRVAVEIDGFGFGHQAQQRIAENNEKQNAAVQLGWRVLRYDSRLLGSRRGVDDAVEQVVEIICNARARTA